MADAAVLQQLAPTGKLRIAVAVEPSPSAQFAIKDGDTIKGTAVTLGKALAKKLGVPAEVLPHSSSGEIQNSAADNKWDVAFLPVDAERKKFVDFGNAYHLLQSTFLVAPGTKMQSVKDADAAGVGIGGVANTATFRAATASTPKATHIEFKGVDIATQAMLERSRRSRCRASRRRRRHQGAGLAHSRRRILNSTTAVCVPKQARRAGIRQQFRGSQSLGPRAPSRQIDWR